MGIFSTVGTGASLMLVTLKATEVALLKESTTNRVNLAFFVTVNSLEFSCTPSMTSLTPV